MPQIETKIICNNCDYDYGQTYIGTIPELTIDDILENFYHCDNCDIEICDNCMIEEDGEEQYRFCESCGNKGDNNNE